MDARTDSIVACAGQCASEHLNRDCFCITLDDDRLRQALEREAGDAEFHTAFIRARPHLFSHAPVFLSQSDTGDMLRIVRAIEAATTLPGYREAVLSWAPAIARQDHGPLGVFMGYDFHLAADGPKLIEVNTNAGGAFLNALSARAQRACCAEIETALNRSEAVEFESAVVGMFLREWSIQRGSGTPRLVVIVDDQPEEQYLYPEFVLAQKLLQRNGIEAVIADPGKLEYRQGRLWIGGRSVDLVYNRLVDFALERPEHAALRDAYVEDAVVVTPNPHTHALFADKRNLTVLSNRELLLSWGLPPATVADLAGVPRTEPVTAENAPRLWAARKSLFFKPAGGHGSKAVYRGDKVTTRVWGEIVKGAYVAQVFAAPSERTVEVDGVRQTRKVDFRLYVYDGQALLTAARLYEGQTTNFRTPGGGFAPVFVV